jgi:hypothetical protein
VERVKLLSNKIFADVRIFILLPGSAPNFFF